MLTPNNNNKNNNNIGKNIENTSNNNLNRKVTFFINELFNNTDINDVVAISKCSTKADSKPIVNNNYKYQRKSQPGYKRDYNNYYKNY